MLFTTYYGIRMQTNKQEANKLGEDKNKIGLTNLFHSLIIDIFSVP